MGRHERIARTRPPLLAGASATRSWLPRQSGDLERPEGYRKASLPTGPERPSQAYFMSDPLSLYAVSAVVFGNDAYRGSHRGWADLYSQILAQGLGYVGEPVGSYLPSPSFESDRSVADTTELATFEKQLRDPYSTRRPI